MGRPRRILFSFGTWASGVLCVALLALWGLSRVSMWHVWWAPTARDWRVAASSGSGRFEVDFGEHFRRSGLDRSGGGVDWGWQPWTRPDDPSRTKPTFAGFGVGHYTDIRSPKRGGGTIRYISYFRTTFVILPYPALVLVTAIFPILRWRARRPSRAGDCPTCGYDLRATPDRCPECGAVPAGAKENAEAQRR